MFSPSCPKNLFYAPHKLTVPSYVQSTQYAKVPDNTAPPNQKFTKGIQTKVGTLLYYSLEVAPTMLPDLNEMAAIQAKPTLYTKLSAYILLDYAYTLCNAKICYHTSDKILHVKSDAAYLVMPGDCSHITGH